MKPELLREWDTWAPPCRRPELNTGLARSVNVYPRAGTTQSSKTGWMLGALLCMLILSQGACSDSPVPECIELRQSKSLMSLPYTEGYYPDSNRVLTTLEPGRYQVMNVETNKAFQAYQVRSPSGEVGYVIPDSSTSWCQK